MTKLVYMTYDSLWTSWGPVPPPPPAPGVPVLLRRLESFVLFSTEAMFLNFSRSDKKLDFLSSLFPWMKDGLTECIQLQTSSQLCPWFQLIRGSKVAFMKHGCCLFTNSIFNERLKSNEIFMNLVNNLNQKKFSRITFWRVWW